MMCSIYRRALVLLLFTLAFALNASFIPGAMAAPRTSAAPHFSSDHLVDKPAIRWAIPKRYWTNTQSPIWLGGLRGRVTVIEFFRINCIHCEHAAPSRRALYLKYRKHGLKMVGFQSPGVIDDSKNKENDWETVKRTVARWKIPYPIAFDKNRVLFDKYGLDTYPTVLVVDRKGIIRFQQIGYTEVNAIQLERIVAEALQSKS